jgi:diacylglycerol kinase (ATP)
MADFTIAARIKSISYALAGIATMLRTQHNAWIHAAATVAVVLLAFWFSISALEWLALILAVVAVWSAEALNTAFELLCDVASPEFHPLVKQAKDVAAAAVLVAAVGAAAIGVLIFGPRLLALV